MAWEPRGLQRGLTGLVPAWACLWPKDGLSPAIHLHACSGADLLWACLCGWWLHLPVSHSVVSTIVGCILVLQGHSSLCCSVQLPEALLCSLQCSLLQYCLQLVSHSSVVVGFFFFFSLLNFLTVVLKQKAEKSLQLKLLSVDGFEYSIKKKPVFLPSDIKNQGIPCTV